MPDKSVFLLASSAPGRMVCYARASKCGIIPLCTAGREAADGPKCMAVA